MQQRVDIKKDKKIFAVSGFILVAFAFWSQKSSAALTLLSYSGSQNYNSTVNNSITTIYAGMTANSSLCTSSSSTCDSCSLITTAIAATTACSTMEVRPTTDGISFSVKSDSSVLGTSGGVFSITATPKAGGTAGPVTLTSNPTLVANTATTYSVLWKDICTAVGVAGCTDSFPTTLTLGWAATAGGQVMESFQFGIKFRYVGTSPAFATNCNTAGAAAYQGFCYFTAYPGAEKAYIFPKMNTANSYVVQDLHTAPGTPAADASGMTYDKLRVCWLSGSTTGTMKPGGSSCTDLKLDVSNAAHPTTSPMYVSGLTNGVPYYFNIGSMDQAGIVTYFLDPTPGANFSWATTVAPPQGATQAVIPGPVYGLLDGQSCFIATAAYGSIMAPEVNTFRKFRSEFLLQNELGRTLVRTYYKYSPPLADFIAQHEILRFVARVFLFPILIFVKLALWVGLLPALSLLLVLFGFGLYLQRRKKIGGVI